ncbi:MAG: hypothetical protein PHX51_04855 [Clostridia bacterium]|nr:hypothetical protein [Clostridia bacterium]
MLEKSVLACRGAKIISKLVKIIKACRRAKIISMLEKIIQACRGAKIISKLVKKLKLVAECGTKNKINQHLLKLLGADR